MQMLVKQHKDPQVQKAYSDCFLLLTKHYYEQAAEDKQVREFLVFTYKEMLGKLLGGRMPANCGLNTRFFTQVFEQCPRLGWYLVKPLLRCFLPKGSSEGADKGGDEVDGSRSNTQRMFAIELCATLVKASAKDSECKVLMAKNFPLLAAVICKVVQTSESWQQKKVKKTGLCVGLFPKCAKIILTDESGQLESEPKEMVRVQGAKMIKELEAACEKDKSMSNLKGKVKEI